MAFSYENQNFFALYYVLIKFGTKALNEVLRFLVHQTFPSATTLSQFLALPRVQKDLCPTSTRGYLDPMQKDLLYPSGVASTTIDYGDLDITLVTLMLKNVSAFSGLLYQPCNPSYSSRTLWRLPTERDQRNHPIEANVVLLKNKRNEIAHSRKPYIRNADFEKDFDDVKSWVMNIMREAGSTAFTEDDIEQYRENFLLRDVFQETVTKLLESLEETEELQDEVKRLVKKQAQTEERMFDQIGSLTQRSARMMNMILSLIVSNVVCFGMLVWNTAISYFKSKRSLDEVKKDIEELKQIFFFGSKFRRPRKRKKEKIKHKTFKNLARSKNGGSNLTFKAGGLV